MYNESPSEESWLAAATMQSDARRVDTEYTELTGASLLAASASALLLFTHLIALQT